MNGAGVLVDILDGGADRIGVDPHHLIDQVFGEPEGLLAHALDCRAIGEEAHLGQRHPLATLKRLGHGVGVLGLHANDERLRPQGLDEGGHAGHQSATAHGHEDGIDGVGVLAQNFHAHCALAGDHIGVVEGVNKGEALGLLQREGMVVGIGVGVAMQDDLRPAVAHGLHLHARGGHRHDNHRPAAQCLRSQGHTLGMVAGRGCDHPPGPLLRREVGHFVVSPSELEGKDGLGVLALEEHPAPHPAAQAGGGLQRRFVGHIVDTGIQDVQQVIRGHASSVKGHRRVLGRPSGP